MKNVVIEPLERFATENRVVDDTLVKFTLSGDGFVNAPLPIGSHVELRLIHIFDMRDGKIAKEKVFELWREI